MSFLNMLLMLRHSTCQSGIVAWVIAKTELQVCRNQTADIANCICALQHEMNRAPSVDLGLHVVPNPIMIYNVK